MLKYLTIIILVLPLLSFSQSKLTFQKADSLSYQYFLKGDWSKLKEITNQALEQKIDTKFIRQRAGYASFMTADYYAALHQYGEALAFDKADDLTREYLYYSNLNAGSVNTRFSAGGLSDEAKKRLGIVRFNPVESVDAEFNLKTNKNSTRSNQVYSRIGVNTELGYRISLYQAISYYEQTVSTQLTQQPEYLALLKLTITPVWHVKAAYHHLFTTIASVSYPANLGFIGLSSNIGRYSLEANGALYKSSLSTSGQMGFQAGVVLPGTNNIYLNSAVYGLVESANYRTVFSQTAGMKCYGNLWAEGNVTLGNLKNYTSNSGLYVYNALDPSVFRAGCSLIYFVGKHLSLSGNFTFDQQELANSSPTKYYNQYSFSGGIKWKL